MPTGLPASKTVLTTEEIVLLSREIQAMIGAGVPLDFGLMLAAGGLPERLEEVSKRLASDIQQGMSLPEALQHETDLPVVYKAVLVAGLECGRSEEVLDDVCQLSQSLVDLKVAIRRGLIYPLVVVGLCVLFMLVIFPRYLGAQIRTYEDMRTAPPEWMENLLFTINLIESNKILLIAGGLLFSVLIVFLKQLHGMFFGQASLSASMTGIPGIGRVLNYIDLARTTNVLSLLTKYDCPLPFALKLTAQTSESKVRQQQFLNMSEDVEQGLSLQDSMGSHRGFPPFLCWMIANGEQGSLLSSSLSQASEFYRSQAMTHANIVRVIVPAAIMVFVAGGVTLTYGLTIFGPMTQLWEQIGR